SVSAGPRFRVNGVALPEDPVGMPTIAGMGVGGAIRWSIRALAGLVVALALFVLFARAALELPATERWLARQVSSRTDDALPGHLHLEEVDVIGWTAVELRGVRLLTADGQEVARADSARATLDPAPLRRRIVSLSSLRVWG